MNWSDITIAKYYEIVDIMSVQDDYTALNLIDSIYGVNSEEIKITELGKYSLDFLKEPIKDVELPRKMVLNGRKYDADYRLTKLTASQFIDYQSLSKDKDMRYEKILSVFIVPKGHKYNDGYDIEEVRNDISSMSIETANSIAKFFFLQFQMFAKLFRFYLTQSLEEMDLTEEQRQKLLGQMEGVDSVLTELSLL